MQIDLCFVCVLTYTVKTVGKETTRRAGLRWVVGNNESRANACEGACMETMAKYIGCENLVTAPFNKEAR